LNKLTLSFAAVPLLWCAVSAARVHIVPPRGAELPAGRGLSVVTLNMAKVTDAGRIASELRASPELRPADLLLLQEVKDHTAADVAAALGLQVAEGKAVHSSEQGLAILSRYPLTDVEVLRLPAYDLVFHSRFRFAIGATAMTPAGPLRVFDTHLDTRLNAADRLRQLAPVVQAASRATVPVVIGGDFNSNGFYWLGHVVPLPVVGGQCERVWRFMEAGGYRSTLAPSTTTFDWLGMHLDWIWARGLRVGESAVYPLEFSDHHAVLTRIAL